MPGIFSPLARQIPVVATKPPTIRKPWGFLIHTTGRGVPSKAAKTGRRPIDVALEIYAKSQSGKLHPYQWGGPTYVLDHSGELYQLAPDNVVTYHAGGPDREDYLDGDWIKRTTPAALAAWRKAWPRHKSPQNLYPSRSANTDYVGIECIPCGAGFGTPMRPGLLFTAAQHDALVDLGYDMAERHDWPRGWERTPRLVGHEDVQLLERQDAGGGWDPGWLRARPYIDFEFIRRNIGA
jgi:hypothetical protein